MASPSYGSIASTSSRANTSTVPPPSTSCTRRDASTPPGLSSSPRSTLRTPRRQRLHRPSLMSLSDRPPSPRALVTAGSGSGSGSSLGSPYSQTLRHRQSRRAEDGEILGDNWTSLRDMVSKDEEEDEETNDHSDTSTLRPTRTRTEPSGPRSMSSVTSVRSFFTARSSLNSERSGVTIRGSPDGLLSSSPPQMNGGGNMEEVLEDGEEGISRAGSLTTVKDDGLKGEGNETQPLLQSVTRSPPSKPG